MLALGLVASSASSVHASTLRLARGDQVVYYVVVPGNGLEMVVAMVVGEDAPCTDGFDRSFTCAAVSLTYSSPGVAEQTIPVMLSRQHAEALSSGDASASARQFARPSWLWLGYPGFRATTDGDRQLREGIRVALVGGLDIPLRLALGAQIETMLSGSRLAVAFGDPTVEVRQLDGEQVRYVLTPDAGQLFPLAFQVESADGTLLASATRTGVARGSRAISFAGWTPLDFPAQRLGLTFVPWDRLPPSDGSALYYPLGEAERFAALSPTMALRNGQHPDWYQLLALLIERADSLTGDAATSLRTASWVFWNGSAALQSSWDGGAERRGPDARPDLHVDSLSLFPPFPGFTPDELVEEVPARSALPDLVLSADDAFEFARSRTAIGSEGFIYGWIVLPLPGLAGTPDGVLYALQCGTGESWLWPEAWVWVSAVNGQVLTEVGTAVTECVRGSEPRSARGTADPLAILL